MIIKQIFLLLLFVLGIVILYVYVFQRNLIYFPDPHTPKLPKYQAEDMNIIKLKTKDNLKLSAWYKPAHQGKPTILYLHGNAGHIGYRVPIVRPFIDKGYGVLLLEYRGYGGNPGKPTENGLYLDADAGVEFLTTHGVEAKRLVLYGESLGSGVATYIAVKHPPCALILQAPFTSMVALAKLHYPYLFIEPWDKFESIKRMKLIKAPLLVFQGKRDSIVPYEEGLAIFNAANEPKKMYAYEDKNHNDIWTAQGFYKAVDQFIDTYCTSD